MSAYLALVPLLTAEPIVQRFSFRENHMGTQFKIIVYAPDEEIASKGAKAAFSRVAELDRIMSDYRADSELMQLCQKAGGPPVKVSEDLLKVLTRAQEVSRLSDGAFDVTVGPMVRLWRRARYAKTMPDPKELEHAKSLVGYRKLHLDPMEKTVRLEKPGMRLDLGGIAKGYAADAVLQVLRKHGITRALIAAGGDIAVSGPPPDADGWRIGIAPLEDPDKKPERYLSLKDGAVSTSGDAEQFVEVDGKRYSHIVDPRTGIGLVGRMSVTVVARDATSADSLTKVVCILGPEKGLPLIEQKHASGLAVRKTDSGEEVIASKHFPKQMVRER